MTTDVLMPETTSAVKILRRPKRKATIELVQPVRCTKELAGLKVELVHTYRNNKL
jgi:hypothetical protein